MRITSGAVPGISCLAKLEVKLSRKARQGLQWFDCYKSRGCNAGLTCRYFVSETFEPCPIFILGHSDGEVSLKTRLLSRGILTEDGRNFRNLEDKYVRANTLPNVERFLACL